MRDKSIGYSGSQPALASAPDPRVFDSLYAQAGAAVNELERKLQRLACVTDRFIGAVPSKAVTDETYGEPRSVVDQLRTLVETIGVLRDRFETELQRLETL